ncbi:hypothetical protein A8C32_14860 [Flavivirga aquatica]|uniref:TonB C-terminal domain-containing protein n=1 Tax=Flavivirga aquatica TaxID=1849968 RepID=A0A1E5T8R0_9FLAO|nr:hypothetical protein [Flavivirga aquatica]OEK07769.1 hypothetical protein A8C32_14860 [Flavivirga aquatica]
MKKICFFLFLLILTSCEYFNVKKTSSEIILKEELESFNWNDVDEYPSFPFCDSSTTKEERKVCFQETLTMHITGFLEQEVIVVTQDINDTISLYFEASKEGELSLLKSKIDSLTINEIPNIETLFSESLKTLPKIFPAIKRGQQVTTVFELPIVIQVVD